MRLGRKLASTWWRCGALGERGDRDAQLEGAAESTYNEATKRTTQQPRTFDASVSPRRSRLSLAPDEHLTKANTQTLINQPVHFPHTRGNMVRGSLGRSIDLGEMTTTETYPMFAIPVKHFLALKKWQPHQDLLAAGKLIEIKAGETLRTSSSAATSGARLTTPIRRAISSVRCRMCSRS